MTRVTIQGRDNWHNPAEARRHDALTFGKTTLAPVRHRIITISRGDALAGVALFAAIAAAALI